MAVRKKKVVFFILVSMGILFVIYNQGEVTTNHSQKPVYKDFPNMTLIVRTAATPRLKEQFYCMFLRTVILFWPAMYGDIVLILDDKSADDEKFGDTILKQVNTHFPEYSLRIFYEPLPKNPSILNGKGKNPLYTRQLWSQFFSYMYTNESIIAYMDTDVLFLTPISKENLVNGKKLKVFGHGHFHSWVHEWDKTTKKSLGLPQIANFMVTFPQLVHRDTYVNCKQHILKHLNTTDFDKAFSIFHWKGTILSPVNILLTFAWFHEKDHYDWHIKLPSNTSYQELNRRLPKGHKIQPKDTIPDLIPVAHISDTKTWLQKRVTPGYCLSIGAQEEMIAGCEGVTHNFSRICDFHEDVFLSPWLTKETWCKGIGHEQCCEKAVNEHYQHVQNMARIGVHTVHRHKAELVSTLAKEMGVQCEALEMP